MSHPNTPFSTSRRTGGREKLGQEPSIFKLLPLTSGGEIATACPTKTATSADGIDGITIIRETLTCEFDRILLDVIWATDSIPNEDLSVFVKAFDAQGNIVAQADQFAPVYGWRPMTTWTANEQIRDIYPLDVSPSEVEIIRYGMYRSMTDGSFENVSEYTMPVNCPTTES